MNIRDLEGGAQSICIIGFGREGQAMLKALEDIAWDGDITLADKKKEFTHPNHPALTGDDYLEQIDAGNFDLIIKSPGVPPHPLFEKWGKKLTTPTQIFFDSIKDTGAMVIGVTGSKGKSTTSSLIAAILKEDSRDAHLVGNIGEPAISHIDNAKKDAIFVMELSSYQLMDLTVSPHIAVVTSFFPEHLDYHASATLGTGLTPLEAYLEAKKHIARFQTPQDSVYFCPNFSGCIEIAKEGEGRKIPFSEADSPVTLDEINLIGEHNLSNIAGAYKVCESLGVHPDVAVKAIKAFKGLKHRLQMVGTHHGIDWVDDAISTTPESAIAALHALTGKVDTIILGGQDRGYDFAELAQEVVDSSVTNVILFPDTGVRIRASIEATDASKKIALHDAVSMEEAVMIAKKVTKQGSVCLLSTASPSYNMFKNFEDKGDQFQRQIQA